MESISINSKTIKKNIQHFISGGTESSLAPLTSVKFDCLSVNIYGLIYKSNWGSVETLTPQNLNMETVIGQIICA